MKIIYIPKELINIILEYDGRIKYRNGKYINQLNFNNDMYNYIKQNIENKKFILQCLPLNYRILNSVSKIGMFDFVENFKGFEELEFICDDIKPYSIYHHIIRIYDRNKNNILMDCGQTNFNQQFIYLN
jgi:hypothetical protein